MVSDSWCSGLETGNSRQETRGSLCFHPIFPLSSRISLIRKKELLLFPAEVMGGLVVNVHKIALRWNLPNKSVNMLIIFEAP